MKSNTALKKAWNITTTAIVILVVAIAAFLMGSRLIGFRIFTVISGSMEPKYSVGDLIYVQEVDPEEIKVGDPITFVLNEDLVVATHQVISIDTEKQHFYTQGLANDTPDAAPVHFNNLVGKPIFAIPYLGYVSDWIQHPPGTYITIALGILLVIALFLPDILRKKDDGLSEAADAETEKHKLELEQMRAELEAAKAELEAERAKQTKSEAPKTEPQPESGEVSSQTPPSEQPDGE